MADLRTRYLGIELKNPVIAGASRLTASMDTIRRIEEAGAGALVTASLFEEEVQLERFKHEEDLHKYDERYPEHVTFFPDLPHAGPREHLMWVRKTKEAARVPVIGSLNATSPDVWIDYARRLQDTGVDALELNFFHTPLSADKTGAEIEQERLETLGQVRQAVTIPISAKLSHFHSNPLHVIRQMDEAGVNGFVLFNRLFQPDIDPDAESHSSPFNLSEPADHRLPLRYAGLLHGTVRGDVCCSTGIFTGRDVAKMILAGAACVQVVSALYRNGISHLATIVQELEQWMDGKGYRDPAAFRGKMSAKNTANTWVYRRDQYVKLLMKPEEIIRNYPAESFR